MFRCLAKLLIKFKSFNFNEEKTLELFYNLRLNLEIFISFNFKFNLKKKLSEVIYYRTRKTIIDLHSNFRIK